MHATRRHQLQLVCTYHMSILSMLSQSLEYLQILLCTCKIHHKLCCVQSLRKWACMLSAPLFAIARALCATLDIDSRRSLPCCNRCSVAELQGCVHFQAAACLLLFPHLSPWSLNPVSRYFWEDLFGNPEAAMFHLLVSSRC